jgi:hypothetical protein
MLNPKIRRSNPNKRRDFDKIKELNKRKKAAKKIKKKSKKTLIKI